MRFLVTMILLVSSQIAFANPSDLSSEILFDSGRKTVSFKVVFEKRMNCNLMKKMDVGAFNGRNGLVFRDITYTTLPDHRPRHALNSMCTLRGTSEEISVRPFEKLYFTHEREMRLVKIQAYHSDGVMIEIADNEIPSTGNYPQEPGYPQYPQNPQQPQYPQHPQEPDYPQYPQNPQEPGYPQYPQHPQEPQYPQYPQNPQEPQLPDEQCPTEPLQPYNPHTQYPQYPQQPSTYCVPQNPQYPPLPPTPPVPR